MRSHRIRMLGVVVVMLSPLILWAGEGQIRRSPNAVKDEYIVVLNDDTPRDRVPELARQLSKAHGGELKRVWGYAVKGFFVRMNESQAFGLSHNPHIKYIEENAEMFLSASAPTKIDPSCTPSPCATSDDRLWHLDVLDQKSAIPNNEYRYCSTGSGVYVYVIDTGVVRAHHEFNNDPNRVVAGYDASGDPSWFPAWDPLHGFPSADMRSPTQLGNVGHGTGVASLVAGKNVGVARDAIIVPVKTEASARNAALKLEQNKTYVLDQIVYGGSNTYYKITTPGVTNAPRPGRFPWKDAPCDPVPCPWGEVEYEYLDPQPPSGQTVQMVVDGLDWILRPSEPDANGNLPPGGLGSPYPKTPAVVTLSTYQVVCGAGVTKPECTTSSLEDAIGSLLEYNNGHGITVIASANNQDSNACETSPGRMSRNNPNKPNDPDQPYKVITAGGTMLRNIPDPVPNPASGGPAVSQSEPAYDSSKPTLLARWRCHAGDSNICTVGSTYGPKPANIYSDPPPTIPNPLTTPANYASTTLGSNWGRCVTLFAPAKNIQVASHTATNGYRDPRATGAGASGTSWSAPIVAAMAARILQGNPNLTIQGVYNALMSHTTETLDPRELQPPGQTGTPRNVLQLADVVASPLPNTIPKASSASTAITVSASATTAITSYELFRVNADYDLSLGRFNAAASISVATSLSSTFQVNPSVETSYFVRVHTNCGSADTNITTVTMATPPAPTGFTATTGSGSVSFGWSPVSGADSYRVERKLPGLAWATAITVSGGSASSASESAPSAPEGVVLYRVRALAASVASNPSNNDVAWVGAFSDEPVVAQATTIKGAHIVQMRRAVNGLCLAADLPPQYATAEVAATAMNGLFIDDAHFIDLRTRLNAARTNPAVGLPAMSFQTTSAQNGFVLASQIDDLRRGVK